MVDDVELATDPPTRMAARRKLERWIEDNGVVNRVEHRSAGVLRGGRSLIETEGLSDRLGIAVQRAKILSAELVQQPVEPKRFVEIMRSLGHVYEEVIDLNGQLDLFTSRANRQVLSAWSSEAGIGSELPNTTPWRSTARTVVGRLWQAIGTA